MLVLSEQMFEEEAVTKAMAQWKQAGTKCADMRP